MCEHRATGYSGGQRGWRIRGPATQSRRRSSAGGCSACFVPVEPGAWDLSMEMPCFMDGWGILVELSMKSACFMDEGRVLVCLSMKSLDFMDGWGLVGSLRLEFLCGIAAVTFGKIACKYYICMVNN